MRLLTLIIGLCLLAGAGLAQGGVLRGLPVKSARPVAYLPDLGPVQPGRLPTFFQWPGIDIGTRGDRMVFLYEDPLVMMGPAYDLRAGNPATGALLKKSLAPGFRAPFDPRLGPDGQAVLFTGSIDAAPPGIWRTDLNGTPPVRLTSTAYGAAEPAWSPDGKAIAFVKQVEHRQPGPEATVTVKQSLVVIDSAPPYPVLHAPRLHRPTLLDIETQWISWLRYSPDSRWIACSLGSRFFTGLVIVDARTGVIYPLFYPATAAMLLPPDQQPGMTFFTWLPDSRSLLVQLQARDYQHIWRVSVNGEAEDLGDGLLINSTSDGRLLYLRKDRQVLQVELDLPRGMVQAAGSGIPSH